MNVYHIVLVLYIASVVMSVVLHEVAHGFMAKLCGDSTAEAAGRLSFNPIHHIDPVFTILVPIITIFASGGSLIFGGAKPVPVNPYFFRNLELDDLKVSLAGVTVNIAIALGAGLTLHVWRPDSMGYTLFTLITVANVALALFNLIPIPPLDGSHVARFLLGRVSHELAAGYERIGMFGLLLVVMFAGVFRRPILTAIDFFWTHILAVDGPAWYSVIGRFWANLWP